MRAGLASLSVLEDERLGARSEQLGALLRSVLTERLQRFEMFEEVRGLGLLNALVFRRPRSLARRALFDAFGKVHAGMFGQMVVRELYLREGILTQMCGNNFLALKVAPPLTTTEAQIERFVDAAERTLERIHSGPSFWTGSLAMARRAVGI
jgi:ornithine--oxo-acid transaminase